MPSAELKFSSLRSTQRSIWSPGAKGSSGTTRSAHSPATVPSSSANGCVPPFFTNRSNTSSYELRAYFASTTPPPSSWASVSSPAVVLSVVLSSLGTSNDFHSPVGAPPSLFA